MWSYRNVLYIYSLVNYTRNIKFINRSTRLIWFEGDHKIVLVIINEIVRPHTSVCFEKNWKSKFLK